MAEMKNEAARTGKQRKTKLEILEEGLPHFEQFIESRESYIKALEATIEVLRRENLNASTNNLAIRSSIDELVAMQRMSNSIGTAGEPDQIVSALMDLTRQVISVLDSDIFLFDEKAENLLPLAGRPSGRLQLEAEHQMEAGIVDWVIAEKKTVVIPDLEHMVSSTSSRNFVIVPLILRGKGIDFDRDALERLGLNDDTTIAQYIENCTSILDADLEEAVRAGGLR